MGLLICYHLCQIQYLIEASKYLGCGILQDSMYQGGMNVQRSRMLDTGRQRVTGLLLGAPEVINLQN